MNTYLAPGLFLIGVACWIFGVLEMHEYLMGDYPAPQEGYEDVLKGNQVLGEVYIDRIRGLRHTGNGIILMVFSGFVHLIVKNWNNNIDKDR